MKIVTGLDLPDLTFAHEDQFTLLRIQPIGNSFVKPEGGVWFSPPGTWLGWCRDEDWGDWERKVEQPVDRRLLADQRFIVIDTFEDLEELLADYELEQNLPPDLEFTLPGLPDFEALARVYDGIYLTEAGQWRTRTTRPSLYGWDIESVLWFGPSEGRS